MDDAWKAALSKITKSEEVIIPDSFEVVYSWRSWVLRREVLLGSINCREMYPSAKALEATCNSEGRGAGHAGQTIPVETCTCGIYASRVPSEPWTYIDPKHTGIRYTILGILAMWGKVVEGGKGWRSQYAYPQFLILMPPSAVDVEERIKELDLSHAPMELEPRTMNALEHLYKFYKVPVILGPRAETGHGLPKETKHWIEMLGTNADSDLAKRLLEHLRSGGLGDSNGLAQQAADKILSPSGGLITRGL